MVEAGVLDMVTQAKAHQSVCASSSGYLSRSSSSTYKCEATAVSQHCMGNWVSQRFKRRGHACLGGAQHVAAQQQRRDGARLHLRHVGVPHVRHRRRRLLAQLQAGELGSAHDAAHLRGRALHHYLQLLPLHLLTMTACRSVTWLGSAVDEVSMCTDGQASNGKHLVGARLTGPRNFLLQSWKPCRRGSSIQSMGAPFCRAKGAQPLPPQPPPLCVPQQHPARVARCRRPPPTDRLQTASSTEPGRRRYCLSHLQP